MRALRGLVAVALLAAAAAGGYRYGVRTAGTAAQPATRPLESSVEQRGADSSPPTAVAVAPSTIAEVLALPSDFTETAALYALAARSDEAALRELIAQAEGIAHRGDRAAALGILFSRYGDLDPQAALRHLDETGIGPKADLLFTIFDSWAKVDLDAAIAAAHEREHPGERRVANDAILRANAGAGSAVRQDVAARLSSTSGGTPYSPDALVSLAGTDPEMALEHALALPAGVATEVVNTIGGRWASRDPEAAYAYVARIPNPSLRRWFKRGVLFAWGQRDPEGAMRLLEGTQSVQEQEDVINSSLMAITLSDPETALRLSLEVKNSALRDAAFRVVARTWAPQDASAAATAVAGVSDVVTRTRLAELVVPSLPQRWSPEQTLEWAAAMDDASGRVTTEAFRALAQQDAPRAFALAATTSSRSCVAK